MITGIDHLVVAVGSVEDAARLLERDLGLAATGGGRHESMGTYNRLAFLGDTYLELIGVSDAGLARSSGSFAVARAALDRLQARGEGLATYALAVDDAAGEAARLRHAGSPIGDPVAGSRRRADGEIVRWTCAFPELGPDRPPFLIEHEDAGSEWGPAARAERAAFRHPVGGVARVASLELPVADPRAVAREYGEVLGVAFSEGWRAAVGTQSVVLRHDRNAREPIVTLSVEPGTAPLELVCFGIRWRRIPRDLP